MSNAPGNPSTVTYHEDQIQTLNDAAHIRLRPGMYLGNVGAAGFHHLVCGPLFNAADEARAGFADRVEFTLLADGSYEIADNGRGIPVFLDPQSSRPVIIDTMACCPVGKWPPERPTYRVFTALFGLGATLTALSEWCEVETICDGERYRVGFERGQQTEPLTHLGPANGHTGLRFHFKPDPEIFGDHTFDLRAILHLLCTMAFLHSGVRFTFTDARTGRTDTFHFADGLTAHVKYLNTGEEVLHEPIRLSGKEAGIGVEVALQYTIKWGTWELGYVNGQLAPQGGTHISGLRRGLREAFRRFVRARPLWPDELPVMPEDIREGITAVVSISHPDPQWLGATRTSLGNTDAEQAVARVVRDELSQYLEAHPAVGLRLCEHIARRAEHRVGTRRRLNELRAASRPV